MNNNIDKNVAKVFSNYITDNKIKIGDTFMINPEYFRKFTIVAGSSDGEFWLAYSHRQIVEINLLCEMLLLVKYVGNGIIQELVSGEKIRIDTHPDFGYSYEDINEFGYTKDHIDISFDDLSAEVEPSAGEMERYMKNLNSYKSFASEMPIMYRGEIIEVTSDKIDEYNEFDDEERKKAMNYVKSLAEKSRKEVLSEVDKSIAYYSLTGSIEMTEKTI